MKKLLLTLCTSSYILASVQAAYIPVAVTGYNADVIANGIGTGLTTTSADVDGASYSFVSVGWQQTAASTPLNWGLPANGIINSTIPTTAGLSFNLANYSSNNSLRIATNGTTDSLVVNTLNLQATKLFVLATSGSGISYFTGQINFTDGTNQPITTAVLVPDWYFSVTQPVALSGFGRINRTTNAQEQSASDPRLFQIAIDILPANQTKAVRSVQFTKAATSATGAVINIFGLSAEITTQNDAGIASLVGPLNFCIGNQNVVVKAKNFGNNIVNSATINWSMNGVTQTTVALPQALDVIGGTGVNEVNVTLGSYNFTGGPVTLKTWTSNPNGTSDGLNINDTLTIILHPGLAGSYTINAALPTGGTNYNSFSAFTNALNTYGMCAPVVANVVPGSPYTDFISLNNIQGSSATNTLRINGNGATIQYPTDVTNRHMLILNGTKYTRIDSLNFVTQGATYGCGAVIYNGALNDSITNCVFDLQATTTTSSTNSFGIAFSNSLTSATTAGTNGSNCYIYNNQINCASGSGGAYYGITLAGANSNNIIKKNKINNFYFYGIYSSAGTNNSIEENEIHRSTKTAVTTYYGIYATGTTSGLKINANRMHSPGGTVVNSTATCYPIYFTSFTGDASNPSFITNNAIYNLNQGGVIYGIYITTGTQLKVLHNTVDIASIRTGTSVNAGIYVTGTNAGTEFKNNNISITGGTTGTKHGMYFAATASLADAQKNNIYVNSTQTGIQNYIYLTTAYASQTAFQTAYPAYEIGSPTLDPQYVSVATGDLTPGNSLLYSAGSNLLTTVPNDINNAARTTTPTIGAFQHVVAGLNNAQTQAILNPTGNICAATTPVEVIIKNAGNNDINNLIVNWSLNGVTQTPTNYTNTLVTVASTTGQNSDTIVIGNANLLAGANTVKVWTSMPNGLQDSDHSNDTIQVVINTVNFTITPGTAITCATGSTTFNLSPTTGYASGTIQWEASTDGGATWAPITGATTTSYTATSITTNRQYRVKVSNNTTICYSNVASLTVQEAAITNTTPGSRCGTGSVTLSATGTGTSYKWYTAVTGGTAVFTGNPFNTPSISANTTYYVSATNSGGCESSRTAVIATVNLVPQVNLGPNVLICPGNSTTLNGASTTPSVNYLWNTGATTPTLNVSTTGTYSIAVNDGTCVGRDTIVVGAAPVPTALLQDTLKICDGVTAVLNAGNPGANFVWSNGSTSQTISTGAAGLYKVQVTNSNSCLITDSTYLVVNPLPIVDLGIDTTICQNSTIVLDAENAGGTYVWSNGATTQTIDINAAGTYSVIVTNEFNCSETDEKEVAIYDAISVGGFTFIPRFDIEAGRVDFHPISPIEVTDYLWDFGDGNTSDLQNPSHVFPTNGNYLVTLKVSNACGEMDTALSIYVDLFVGVKPVNKNDVQVKVYPVPSTDVLNIEIEKGTSKIQSLKIYNAIGHEVLENTMVNSDKTSVKLSQLAEGNYFIIIDTNEGKAYRKFNIIK